MKHNNFLNIIKNCLDAHHLPSSLGQKKFIPHKAQLDSLDLIYCFPVLALHLACLFVFVVGYSHVACVAMVLCYLGRMFAITGFYHRYFSHKTYKTNRFWQFIFAFIGSSAVQRGPIWWAAHHRHHHQHSDKPDDIHSPWQQSFWWSHYKWILSRQNFPVNFRLVRDLTRYPELMFLDRFDKIAPTCLALFFYGLGWALEVYAPHLGTSPWQMVVWGFVCSTVLLLHGTFTINSISHLWGTQPYVTNDQSRNNFFLALITLGEGWHNNHHYAPNRVQQGIHWWQIDITYYTLWLMKKMGIIWDFKKALPTSSPSSSSKNAERLVS